jgi:hypothetical protein
MNDLYVSMCILSVIEMERSLSSTMSQRDLSWDTITLRCYHETMDEIARLTKAEA